MISNDEKHESTSESWQRLDLCNFVWFVLHLATSDCLVDHVILPQGIRCLHGLYHSKGIHFGQLYPFIYRDDALQLSTLVHEYLDCGDLQLYHLDNHCVIDELCFESFAFQNA